MRKIYVLMITVLLLFSLTACGASSDNNSDTTDEGDTSSQSESSNTQSNVVEMGADFETGSYAVTVKSIRKGKDYEGNSAVVIAYDWTNNSDETISWMGSMMTSVFQDGVQLETGIFNKGIDVDKMMQEVRPGTTLEGIEEGFVTTSENALEIEVQAMEEMFGDPVLIKTAYPTE
ncbi:MAG: DUF5067 domain-containing protein [Eubacteriales bacterium]